MKNSLRIAPIAFLLAAVMLFGSCGVVSPKKLISNDYAFEGAPLYTSAEKLGQLSGAYADDTDHAIVVFEDVDDNGNNVYTAYSKLKASIIGKWTDTDTTRYYVTSTVNDRNRDPIPLLVVASYKADDISNKTYTLYAPDGSTLIEFSDKNILSDALYTSGYLFIDGKVYEYDEERGSFGAVADIGAFNAIPSSDIKVYRDMIYASDSDFAYDISVYDLSCAPLMHWEFPSYAKSKLLTMLNNGDLLAQYRVELDANAKKYDLISDGTKYDLVTLLIDRKSGKEKTVNTDYIFDEIFAVDTNTYLKAYKGKIENLAFAYKLEDKMVDTSSTNRYYLSLSNSGKVRSVLSDGDSSSLVYPVSPELYAVEDPVTEVTTLLNKRFKKIGSFSARASYYGKYILLNGKDEIYDASLSVVYTLNEKSSVYKTFSDALMISEQFDGGKERYVLLTSSGEKKTVLENSDSISLICGSNYYCISSTASDGTTSYTYYNTNGDALISTKFALKTSFSGDGYCVLQGVNGGEREWYIFR